MSKDLPPSRTADQFVVRFPDGMRDQIAEAAKANNRSMNAEIVSRLNDSFARDASRAELELREEDIRNSPLFRELHDAQRMYDALTPEQQARVKLQTDLELLEAEVAALAADRAFEGQLLNDVNFRIVAARLDHDPEDVGELQRQRDERLQTIAIVQKDIEQKTELISKLRRALARR